MNEHTPETTEQLTEALIAEHHALQLERQFRRKRPATDRETLDRMLWPIELRKEDVEKLLDRAEDIAYDFKLDVLDVLAVVLAHSTPSERQRIHDRLDEVQLLTLRFGRLRHLLDALDSHVDAIGAEIEEVMRKAKVPWKPETWSSAKLLDRFRIPDMFWPRLLIQRRRRVKTPDVALRESMKLDTHAGAAWLRHLLPKAEIADHEVPPMLAHLGVWALRLPLLEDWPETVRDAAKRILRHLRGIENEEDGWQIEVVRTNSKRRSPTHPFFRRPPQEDW